MYDWIEIDGVKSSDLEGLVPLGWTLPLYTRRKRDTSWIPGRIDQIQSQYPTYEEPALTLELAVLGGSDAQTRSRWMAVKRWLGRGRRIRLSDMPGYYMLGETTQATVRDDVMQASPGDGSWMKVSAIWTLCPACLIRYHSAQAGWVPALDAPIPEQLTAGRATGSKAFTANGYMDSVAYQGLYPARLYLAVTGTWTEITIGGAGGLTVHQAAAASTTLYVDCGAQVIYTLESGVQVNWAGAVSGDYPAPTEDFALAVSGTGINVTVRMLVVEMT